MDEQSSIHDTVDALKSIMQEPHMQRYYAAQERRERLAEGEDIMTDNERPTTITAAQLAAEWEVWQKRIEAGDCKIDANLAGVYFVKHIYPYIDRFILTLDDNSQKDVMPSDQCIIKWLTPAPAEPANDLPPKWSYERLEAEYREICNNLHNLIDETGIGFGNGGEKIDRIVRNAFHQQQAELAAQRARADGFEAKAAAMREALTFACKQDDQGSWCYVVDILTGLEIMPKRVSKVVSRALETTAGSHLLARLESVTIEAKANGDTAMQWKQMFESQQKRAEQAEAERDKFENRYNGLVELIKQQYIDTFVLCWLNVPIEMAVELLAKYAVEGWKIAPNNPDRQAVKDGE